MSIINRVRRFAVRHDMWDQRTRVIAAVSGGADSVALLLVLHEFASRGELLLDAVAHLNHGIRGDEADDDERFCHALADRLNLPFVAERVDVPARAAEHGLSIEVTARNARREFLDRVRLARAADRVATAHTASDQTETIILRILRGTGLRGLGGIAPVASHRIRPMLECTREELRTELRIRQQSWRDDSTNTDLAHPRNRVRLELLPYLEKHFNPSVGRALARLADHARADEAFLTREATALSATMLLNEGNMLRLPVAALNVLPDAVARRVVLEALELCTGNTADFDDVEAVLAVARSEGAQVELSGLQVEHSAGSVVLVKRAGPGPAAVPFRCELPIPGTAVLPIGGWSIEAKGPSARTGASEGSRASDTVEIDAAAAGSMLIVRNRLPGDWIRPLGLAGRKKLQDVFVDRKVPRDERDVVPIVTDIEGRIVWVAGHVLSEEVRVGERTKAVVVLKLRRI